MLRNYPVAAQLVASRAKLSSTELVIPLKNGVFWVLTRATRRNNPEDTILHSHRRENLKSYSYSIVLSRVI
jgi:hypothetical protein